jgi:hypothetical protein
VQDVADGLARARFVHAAMGVVDVGGIVGGLKVAGKAAVKRTAA